ncbi:MAG: hypothetical protein ACK5U4_16940, partial [Rhodospirillales bacterium]
ADTNADYPAGDKIDLSGFKDFNSLASVSEEATDVSGGLLLSLATGSSVLILGKSVADLSSMSGDFIYG